ncbi:hypothetical protein Syun_030950 [Stephania yunnanensis]|uniref:Uncharacterized protein n=1 Tax=Stephania yunnanensis TaxID=152371 RepID=A0AAP0E3F4_9MAGN
MGHNALQSISHNFGDDLVTNITKTDRSEVVETFRIFHFRNKSNKRFINRCIHYSLSKASFYHVAEGSPNNIPILLKEECRDLINSRCFIRRHCQNR